MAAGVITLVQFPTALGLPNLSPFCMKVETWLRLAGLTYQIEWMVNPSSAPMGKLPMIRDGDTLIADSHSIIDHLARTRGKDLDAHLSARERAQALAWERLLAEHLYWSMVYFRWVDDSGWQRIRKYFFSPIPAPVRPLVEFAARRGTRAQTRGHGLGRHAPQEIVRRAGEDIDALAAQLGEQPFLVGAQPTRLDATAYALLANIWQIDFDTPLKPLVARHANLRAYCERMRARCFPEPTS